MKQRIITSVIALSLLATMPAWGQTKVITRDKSVEKEGKKTSDVDPQVLHLRKIQEEKDKAAQELERVRREKAEIQRKQAEVALKDSMNQVIAAGIAKGDVVELGEGKKQKNGDICYPCNGFNITLLEDGIAEVKSPSDKPDFGVIIPQMVKKGEKIYVVTRIGKKAFWSCSKMTGVSLPNTITCIDDSAFMDCRDLTNIDVPQNLNIIGIGAFSGCTKLASIKIPASVNSIGHGAFRYCENLLMIDIDKQNRYYTADDDVIYDIKKTELHRISMKYPDFTIPPTVTMVCDGAFSGCKRLRSVVIPESVKTIESRAFSGSGLRTAKIPSTVSEIGQAVFKNCENLTSATLESPTEIIKDEMFMGCSSLESIDFPSSVIEIGYSAFRGCGLWGVALPPSLLAIGNSAFQGCSKMEMVVLPPLLTSIGDYAFQYCSQITSLGIPSSVMLVGKSAFAYCSNLESFTIDEALLAKMQAKLKFMSAFGYKDSYFEQCKRLKKITIRKANGATEKIKKDDYIR